MEQNIIICPTHPGVNTMPVTWLLSQSPDCTPAVLPPMQFVQLVEGPNGTYPDLESDLHGQTLRNVGNDLNDPEYKYQVLADEIDIIENVDEIWESANPTDMKAPASTGDPSRVIQQFLNIAKALVACADHPGGAIKSVIIVPKTFAKSHMYNAIADAVTKEYPTVNVKSLFVMGEPHRNIRQRLYFTYNAFTTAQPDPTFDDAKWELIDCVNVEFKKEDEDVWTAMTTCEKILFDQNEIQEVLTRMGLAPIAQDKIEELHQRYKEFIKSYPAYTGSLWDPAGGIDFEWNTFLDNIDPIEAIEMEKNLNRMYIDIEEDRYVPHVSPGTPEDEYMQQLREDGELDPNPEPTMSEAEAQLVAARLNDDGDDDAEADLALLNGADDLPK